MIPYNYKQQLDIAKKHNLFEMVCFFPFNVKHKQKKIEAPLRGASIFTEYLRLWWYQK